jgi:formylglycine-generating enzyme required for sulfatase activity
MANQPVVFVTWYDAIRFANWLSNGQGNGDTESGSYTLLGGTPTPSNAWGISRNAGATWVLPSEDEWYKAAYYDPSLNGGSGGYWLYPTKSNNPPTWELSTATGPNAGSNSANFDGTQGYSLTGSTSWNESEDYLTNVGAYPNAVSAYGTLDQGGDLMQWNEAKFSGDRGYRGGSWCYDYPALASFTRGGNNPTVELFYVGFRMASVPEPGSITWVVGAAVAVFIWWRRRR